MAFSIGELNPITLLQSLFGGAQSSGQTTVNINTILAALEVAQAFGVNPGSLNTQQMTAILALAQALGLAVPAVAAPPTATPVPASGTITVS